MQFSDIEEPLHTLRHEHLEREKAANNAVLAANGDLASFDRDRILIALEEWNAFAKEHFNLVEMLPHEPIRLNVQDASVTIRFRMPEGQTPVESGMILAQGMVLLETESSPVVPGSLRYSADGIWQADFSAEQVMSHAFCEGDFDFYLGGTNTDGKTFAGQLIINFVS